MAGTTKDYNVSATAHGPTDIWGKLTVPGAGAEITLHTDGTPDATANATAKHIGMLKTGCTCEVTGEIQEKTSDNLTTPYAVNLKTALATIKGDWLQVLDMDLVALLSLGSTKTTPSGKEKVTWGSLSAVVYTCAAAIWALTNSSTLFAAFTLYKCYNKSGWKAELNRENDAAADLELTAVALTTRADADQVAALWKQTA